MFRKFRIAVWLYVLVLVAGGAWLARERSTDWDTPLWVVIYPIPADGSSETMAFVNALTEADFEPIAEFFEREGKRHGVSLRRPFTVKLARPLSDRPPPPPTATERGMLSVMLWSLELRYWAWQRESDAPDLPADIRMFVTFHPAEDDTIGHDSLALREGLIGLVNAFASTREMRRNNVVIAHELLHTVGATDKYDLATNLPRHPDGYAEPSRDPLLPQRYAELMGGRVPISTSRAETPRGLSRVRIGPLTATEIGWLP